MCVIGSSLGNLCDRSDRSETSDLVPQTVHKDGHTLGQLGREGVANGRHNLTHARDGSLLHLLVNVRCLEALKGRGVDGQDKRLVVE